MPFIKKMPAIDQFEALVCYSNPSKARQKPISYVSLIGSHTGDEKTGTVKYSSSLQLSNITTYKCIIF